MKRALWVLSIIVLIGMGNLAEATPITYTFAGTVDFQTGSFPAVGNAITVSFTYDPAAPLESSGGNFAVFGPLPNADLSAVVGGTSFSSTGSLNYVTEHNVGAGGFPGVPIAEYDLLEVQGSGMTFLFFDPTQSAFTVFNSLPSQLPLGDFQYIELIVNSATGADLSEGLVRITSDAVPEPASMLLLGTGLIGMGARRWRARRQRG